jgi:hypothetical protein
MMHQLLLITQTLTLCQYLWTFWPLVRARVVQPSARNVRGHEIIKNHEIFLMIFKFTVSALRLIEVEATTHLSYLYWCYSDMKKQTISNSKICSWNEINLNESSLFSILKIHFSSSGLDSIVANMMMYKWTIDTEIIATVRTITRRRKLFL